MLNISNFDINATLEAIRSYNDDDDSMRIQIDTIISRAIIHTGSLPGTTPYWIHKKSEFKASVFYSSCIKKREISFFHTDSLDE